MKGMGFRLRRQGLHSCSVAYGFLGKLIWLFCQSMLSFGKVKARATLRVSYGGCCSLEEGVSPPHSKVEVLTTKAMLLAGRVFILVIKS